MIFTSDHICRVKLCTCVRDLESRVPAEIPWRVRAITPLGSTPFTLPPFPTHLELNIPHLESQVP